MGLILYQSIEICTVAGFGVLSKSFGENFNFEMPFVRKITMLKGRDRIFRDRFDNSISFSGRFP